MRIIGLDFTSAPSARKAIVAACGTLTHDALFLDEAHFFRDWESWETFLEVGQWVGAADFPFALPQGFVAAQDWPLRWEDCVAHVTQMGRTAFLDTLEQHRLHAEPGKKEPKRAVDVQAGALSPLKLYHVPTAKMFYAGATRLLASSLNLPPCRPLPSDRTLLEGYPGLVARLHLGRRKYKSEPAARWSPEEAAARLELLTLLEQAPLPGHPITHLSDSLATRCQEDGSGDVLDAVLCATQAAAASIKPNWGIPPSINPEESWILDAELRETAL